MKKLLLFFALLCAFAQGAWAQTSLEEEWQEVLAMTQTTSSNWNVLHSGSTTGHWFGSDGNTTYYRLGLNNNIYNFTNYQHDGSGATIHGTVYLYVPTGITVNFIGANANETNGAGAGIELNEGNTLILLGGGTINATGGNAANGGNGGNGNHSYFVYDNYCQPGSGGNGGNGGGGAGAGIGTRGGNGGTGGSGATARRDENEGTNLGVDGSAGNAGTTSGAMGNLYVVSSTVNLNASGGAAGSNGSGGARGYNAAEDPYNHYDASGGGGGGAGGFGGAANNIGTGGPGGGGGGGGAAGNSAVSYTSGFLRVGAGGGYGGKNGDGSSAANGTTSELTNPYDAEYNQGLSGTYPDRGWEDGNGMHSGGSGGACGNASTSGSAINMVLWPTSGAGTAESPYLMNNANDWNTFAANVSNGISYSGKVIKLTDNISVTTMAGRYQNDANYQPFSGTFDGDGHTLTFNKSDFTDIYAAPFRCVGNASFRNLHVAGTINTTYQYAGGMIAWIVNGSTVSIENCLSSVTINSSSYTNGGFVSRLGDNATLTISGCAFDGSFEGTGHHNGGFVGYCQDGSSATFLDCLFKPDHISCDLTSCQTFLRGIETTFPNCYYTQTLGTAQGTQATYSTTAPEFLGALVHDYGMVKVYAGALLFNGNYYYDASAITSESTTLNTGTYTVYADITISERIQINGNVTLNLSEGTTLHAPKGIEVSQGNSLTINGPGALTIDNCDAHKSGIGASYVGTITINGGTINVAGAAAGIGGDYHNTNGGTITINGGVVNATGGSGSAGIGGGMGGDEYYWGLCATINFNGGQVTARGGGDGPGIGPGCTFDSYGASGRLNLNWTNQDDFIHSTGYIAEPGSPYARSISQITIADGKQFIFDGTTTIVTANNLKNGGETIIVPYEAGQQTLSGAGTQANPYLISSTVDWSKFVHNVVDGNSYSGLFVQLNDDIDITRSVGVYDDNAANARPFSGTFLGNNHTITATITDNFHSGTAPFRYINGATIKNLTIAGTIASGQKHLSGLVGFVNGTNNLIEGCTVNATIDIHNHFVGGIVGHGLTSSTTVKDCIFAGEFVSNQFYIVTPTTSSGPHIPNNIGGIWGWNDDGATPTLQNCLEKGTYTNVVSMHPIGLQGGSGSITNCYYLTPQIGSPSNACTVSGAYRVYADTPFNNIYYDITAADGNTYYLLCPVSGIAETYNLSDGVSITPVVTDPRSGNTLTLGTNYTATLNGQNVAAFPFNIDTRGEHTIVLTGNGNYHGSNSNNIYVLTALEGEGTAENPYIICDDLDWCAFATNVNNGTTYSGKYLKLTTDISVSTMVGTSEGNSFQGTFLGDGHTLTFNKGTADRPFTEQYCAAFRHIRGATIKDLNVTGDIYTSSTRAAGLVGRSYGQYDYEGLNSIINCRVSTVIHSSFYGNGNHGGIAAESCYTLHITGCIYDGRLFSINGGTLECGGIVGYGHMNGWAETYVTNSLYAPDPNIVAAEGETPINSGATIVFYNDNDKINNCFYTETMGNSQGRKIYTITPGEDVTLTGSGTPSEYNVSGLTAYTNGIKYNGVFYGGSGSNVNLTLGSNRPGYVASGFQASAGTLTGSTNPYTLTMPDENVTISVTGWTVISLSGLGTENDPYLINNTDDWNTFVNYISSGFNFYGKYFKLTDNISVTTMAGVRDDNPFNGTFDGDGHTITANINSTTTGEGANEQGVAPFHYINNATINNLTVAGSIASASNYTSGLVGFANGTNLIENCVVTSTLNISCNYAGGIIGHGMSSSTTIEGCVFAGTINGVDGDRSNIGGIWGWSDSGTPTLMNCLEAGTYTNIASMHPMGLQKNKGTITNCYYVTPQIGSPSNACTVSGAKQAYTFTTVPAYLGSLKTVYCMMTVYENGILFDGTYFVANAIILTDNADNSTIISTVNDMLVDVTLANRTLYKNGKWNTLCLPFDVTLNDSPLAGATARPLESASISGSTLSLNFGDAVTTLQAGTPYIIKWPAPVSFTYTATSGTSGTGDEGYDKLLDGNTSTKWSDSFGAPWICEFNTSAPVFVTGYTMTTCGNTETYPYYNPKKWTLEAKATSSDEWIVIDSRDVTTNSDDVLPVTNTTESKVYAIAGEKLGTYQYFRFTVIQSGYSRMQLSELTLKQGSDIVSPVFNNMTIDDTNRSYDNGASNDAQVRFMGIYNAKTFTAADQNSALLMDGNNALYYAEEDDNIGAQRAYFKIGADSPAPASQLSVFNINFSGESTGIISRSVEGYGTGNGKWAFIASPVEGSIAPTAVENIFSATQYDLYRLNPSSSTWENYQAHTDGFNLTNGQGYLYATKETKTLVFSGTFNTGDSETVDLSEGFNLVGNPFIANAYVSKPFYQMNAEGTDIVAVENYDTYTPVTIPPCTGIVVRATGADEVTFSTSAPQQQSANNNGNLQMTLTKVGVRNDAFQDKAIVSFNQGSELEKFIFNENHAKLYIPQDGEDYAIAFSEMSGEVPLNFKATETGRYTININFENVKGIRIQFIDKIEDNIIDLNANDSYTFMGSSADRDDRFTLVFTQVETDGVFAYQSGNDIIVSGNGDLQVFDVMGRMVMNQHINGVQTVEKPSITGVYIFRLNEKSQKIVVR